MQKSKYFSTDIYSEGGGLEASFSHMSKSIFFCDVHFCILSFTRETFCSSGFRSHGPH